MKNILAFDTETREFVGWDEDRRHSSFILGVVYDGKTFYEFYTQEEMIEFFRMPKWAGYQVWACNLEYDLNAVFQGLPNEDLHRSYFGGILKGAQFVQERRMLPAKGERGKKGEKNKSNRILHFCDTLNHWKAGVAKLGEMVGLEKLEMPSEGLPNREMVTYCKRDTEIVWKAVTMFQEEYNHLTPQGGCELKPSIAASSMDLLRRCFLKDEWGHRRIPQQYINFFREGYAGGRTENFVRGRFGRIPDRTGGEYKSIHCADFNSMYPHIMFNTELPVLHEPHCTSSAKCLEYEGMTRCIVEVPEQMYPPLFYRHQVSRLSAKLYFPIGTWEGTFANNELRYAIEHCGVKIHKILDGIYFKRTAPVYREYVETLYGNRLVAKAAGDDVRQFALKIFLNSIYGKPAEYGEVVTIAPRWMRDNDHYEPYGLYARRVQEGKPALYTNFIWAAYVTAGSRCLLHEWLVKLQALYCDTDSIFSHIKMPFSRDLGALAHEFSSPYLEVLGPKTYKMKGKTRMKGVPADAWGAEMVEGEDGFLEFQFRPIAEMDHIPREVFFTDVTRFRGAIARGLLPNSWGIGEKSIRLLPEERKRHFYEDGSSRPLTVDEINAIRLPWDGVIDLPLFKCEGKMTVNRKRAS